MNLNQLFRRALISAITLLLSGGAINAKNLKPNNAENQKEILIISENRRLYYHLDTNTLDYTVHGPVRLQIISREAEPKPKNKTLDFEYTITLDDAEPLSVRHEERFTKTVKSVQHPKYTISTGGSYFINVPAGTHTLKLNRAGRKSRGVLFVRILYEPFGDRDAAGKSVVPTAFQTPVEIRVGESTIKYYPLRSNSPLQVETKGPGILELYSRLAFAEWMGQEEIYRLQLLRDGKLVGTYFFSTEKSTESEIMADQNVVPGKWRSSEIEVPAGKHIYSISILETDRTVYMKFRWFD